MTKSSLSAPPLRRRSLLQAAALLAGAACGPGFGPGCAAASAGATRTLDVIVLGAGLAGLQAARQLEAAGFSVRVLEGSARIGGRVHTLDALPGQPETGGTQIGAAYTRVLASARELGLQLRPTPPSPLLRDDGLVFDIQGRRTTRSAWAASPDNPLPPAVRALAPDRALGRLVGASPLASNPLSSSPLATITAWREPAHAGLDVPALGELRAQGLGDAALQLLAVNNSYGDTLAETSWLNLVGVQRNVTELMKTPGPIFNVVGGNQRLPEAMARALRGDVLLNRRAVAVDSHAAGVSVTCDDGSRHRARRAVCALPLPAMRGLRFTPGLPPRHAEAVQRLAYGRVTQLHLEVLRPFWEADGLLPYLWSDGPLRRIFAQDPQGSGNAQTLTVWINGQGTTAWDDLNEADAARRVADELARVYPSSRGAVRLARRVAWHRNALAGGSWANWAPGQISRYANVLATPSGRVHFAGEHTGLALRGLEAAMESGERAAAEIRAL